MTGTPAAASAPRLLGLGLSAMLVPLGSTMIAVALPSIGQEFARPPAELTNWLVNSYLVVNIVALGPGGRLGDRWGYRNTLGLGQLLFGIGCVLPLLFHAFPALVASRVLMALGGALMVPTVMALLKISLPPERLHRVYGYFGAMMGFAAAAGPLLGGLLVAHFGWASIFVMNLPVLALSLVLSAGFFRASAHGEPVAGAQPLSRRALLGQRAFAAGCAIVGLVNLGMYALLFQLPFLLGLLYAWGPERAGPFMTTFMVSMMAGSALGGRLAERVGPRLACAVGSILAALGLAAISFAAPNASELFVLATLVAAGAGVGLANGPSQSAAMAGVDRSSTGAASGVLSTARYVGGAAGISILGVVLAGAGASLEAHHCATLVFAAAFVLSALVSLALPGRLPRR